MNNLNCTFMSFDEIVDDIYLHLIQTDRDWLTSHSEDDCHQLHSYTGQAIRNNYQLWEPTNPLTKAWHDAGPAHRYIKNGVDSHPDHPDAVSMNIIKTIWRKVNGVSVGTNVNRNLIDLIP